MAKKTARKGNYTTPSRYTIAGRLIKDPETSSFEKDGKTVNLLKLTMVDATKSEKHVDFFPTVTVGGPRVEFLSRLKKGDHVFVTGKPEIRTYEGRNGWGFEFEIRFPDVVEPVTYLGDREAGPAAEPPPPTLAEHDAEDEPLPF